MIVRSSAEYFEFIDNLKKEFPWIGPLGEIRCFPGHLRLVQHFCRQLEDVYGPALLSKTGSFFFGDCLVNNVSWLPFPSNDEKETLIDNSSTENFLTLSQSDSVDSSLVKETSAASKFPLDDKSVPRNEDIYTLGDCIQFFAMDSGSPSTYFIEDELIGKLQPLFKDSKFLSIGAAKKLRYGLEENKHRHCIYCGSDIFVSANTNLCRDHRDCLGAILDQVLYGLDSNLEFSKASIIPFAPTKAVFEKVTFYRKSPDYKDWAGNIKLRLNIEPGYYGLVDQFLSKMMDAFDPLYLSKIHYMYICTKSVSVIFYDDIFAKDESENKKYHDFHLQCSSLWEVFFTKRNRMCSICGDLNVIENTGRCDLHSDHISLNLDIQQNEIEPLSVKLYDQSEYDRAVAIHRDNNKSNITSILDSMPHSSYKQRGFAKLGVLGHGWKSIIDEFEELFPNFSELTAFLRGQLSLHSFGDGRFCFPPVLLLGNPGIGKTEAAMWLSDKFFIPFEKIDMTSVDTGHQLSGTARHWGTAHEGAIFSLLTRKGYVNPIILLDELDKTVVSHNGDPYGPLHTLLEKRSAKTFKDAFITDFSIDASYINWIATANDIRNIPSPILSRLDVMHIPAPTTEQRKVIVDNIYKRNLKNEPWGSAFDTELSDDVIDYLIGCPTPRIISTILIKALGSVAHDGRKSITLPDVQKVASWSVKPTIGFVKTDNLSGSLLAPTTSTI